jgi:hypothetical protein
MPDGEVEHREVEHRKDSKTEMGKARLSAAEIELIDHVRGATGRGVWLREVALRFAATDPLPVLGWPRSIPPDGDRNIDVGFRLTEEQVEAINKIRGGIPLGTWIRETAVRVAGALTEASVPPDSLIALLPPEPSVEKPVEKPVAVVAETKTLKTRRPRSPAPVPIPSESR